MGDQLIDLADQSFGLWLVFKLFKYLGNGRWLCHCDCGVEKEVAGNSLRTGDTKSCGCARNSPLDDIIGQSFGLWLVLKYLGKSRWLCRCDCGTKKEVAGRHLKNDSSKSCGCQSPFNHVDITDQKFGLLTPIKYLSDSYWLCRCDCGNERRIKSANLGSGNSMSCGCIVMTRGEKAIERAIKQFDFNENDYTYQAYFITCRNRWPLPFDFYIPSLNLLIEYQGEGHFRPAQGGYKEMIRTQHHDAIKALWAYQNGYDLLHINYWDCERIAEILADKLQDISTIIIHKQLELF